MADRALGPIVLVGLMASGKSTVGRKISRLIDRPFFDADVELEARTGRSVAGWFEFGGEDAFREAESGVLVELVDDPSFPVVGAGGGVVVRPENRKVLGRGDVTTVYLHGTPRFLATRVKPKPHRPLLVDDPLAVLEEMYTQRDPWYREVADVVAEVQPAHEAGTKPKWRLAEQVVEALVERGAVDAGDVVDPSALAAEEPKS